MNRLQSASDSVQQVSSSSFFSATDEPTNPLLAWSPKRRCGGPRRPAAFFSPVHYESGYAYPLVLWLHDDGGWERQLRRVMPHVSVRNYVAAAIRGTSPCQGGRRFAWDQSPEGVESAMEAALECLAEANERFHVHPRRIFVAGDGAGGTMALRLALLLPEQFAGVVSLGGPLPRGGAPLRRLNHARQTPVMLSYSRRSSSYPEAAVGEDLRLLHAAGFDLHLRQYPAGEGLTDKMLGDMDRWIMDKVCPSTTVASL
jgi:phospholipase/carboxylesterase